MEHLDLRQTPAATEGSVPLTHWGLLRARGADAAAFLHGQLSNDLLGLAPGGLRLAAYCSAKGRMQASFLVWQAAPETILLACHASVLPGTLKRLAMFVLRSRCKLTDAGLATPDPGTDTVLPALHCTGLVGGTALRALAAAGIGGSTTASGATAFAQRACEGGDLLVLPAVGGTARVVWVAPAGQPAPGCAEGVPALPLDVWRWLEVQSGVPVIETGTAEQFVPQMLNFELIGGVDFQKGCYPGQEVVARSQYRGTVKRRMFLFDTEPAAHEVALPGTEVFHSGDPGQPAGLLVNAAPRPDGRGSSALVEVKLAALGTGSLHLGSADGPRLWRGTLPYGVPTEGEVAA